MKLSVIIVSYNTRDLTFNCLQSLYRVKAKLDLEIILVDNASTDHSAQYLHETFPDLRIIQNDQNLGFGVANNQAAQIAMGEYLLFLNSDTEITGQNLQKFIDLADKNHSQMASCRLLNRDHSLQPQGGALPNLVNLTAWMWFIDDLPLINRFFPAYQRRHPGYFTHDRHPGWLAGTALLVKKEIFITLGGFNPAIFMYGEDVDFCYRAHRQQVDLDYFTIPQITHLGQQSGSSQQAVNGEFQFLQFFYTQYRPSWQRPLLRFLLKSGCLLRVIIFGMIGKYEQQTLYRQAGRLV